jgi:Glycosyl hydrolases family 15
MSKASEPFFPPLNPASLKDQLPALREKLESSGTLAVRPNRHGIYPASASQGQGAPSGYQNAWLRDNAMVAFAKWECGDPESAWKTARGLGAFLATQVPRMERIIEKPKRKEDPGARPHVRFDGAALKEIDEPWAHAQNDALGYAAWLRFRLANLAGFALEDSEREMYGLLPAYFRAIQYWKDPDSGAWEESLKVNSSSIGAVMAALTEMSKYRRAGNPLPGLKEERLSELIFRGRRTLDEQLPFEAPPERKTDAALLFLIYPTGMVTDEAAKRLIVSLVRARLAGPFGVRRYIGDSYFCQDFERWFPPGVRSAALGSRPEVRDEFLAPGCEAQWCLFDPLLSVIYGADYRERGREEWLALQLEHANRAISQLDERARCPELYFLKQGRYVPNEHTPLTWTQANLATALAYLERSARAD